MLVMHLYFNVDFCDLSDEEDKSNMIGFSIIQGTGHRGYLLESWENININTITTL